LPDFHNLAVIVLHQRPLGRNFHHQNRSFGQSMIYQQFAGIEVITNAST